MKQKSNPLPSTAGSFEHVCDNLNDLTGAIASMRDTINSAINDLGKPPLPVADEEKTQSITAVLSYYESVQFADQVSALWPHASIAYELVTKIWIRRFEKGLSHAWGKMDYATRARYVDLAHQFNNTNERSI